MISFVDLPFILNFLHILGSIGQNGQSSTLNGNDKKVIPADILLSYFYIATDKMI
jgi:hypothetical protein